MRSDRDHRFTQGFAVVFFLCLLIWGDQAHARTFTSARELQVSCTSTWANKAYYQMYAACRAFVIGVADTLTEIAPGSVCPPEHADRGLLTETVMRALGARLLSEERNALQQPLPSPGGGPPLPEAPKAEVTGSAAEFVRNVLQREFPCH